MGRSYASGGKPRPFEFELDGVSFTAPGGVMLLDLSDFASFAELDIDSPQGAAAIAKLFRQALGEDYGRFAAHCRAHFTEADTLMLILQDLVEHATSRPTVPSGQSSPGRLTTNGSSPDGLPSLSSLSQVWDSDQAFAKQPGIPLQK